MTPDALAGPSGEPETKGGTIPGLNAPLPPKPRQDTDFGCPSVRVPWHRSLSFTFTAGLGAMALVLLVSGIGVSTWQFTRFGCTVTGMTSRGLDGIAAEAKAELRHAGERVMTHNSRESFYRVREYLSTNPATAKLSDPAELAKVCLGDPEFQSIASTGFMRHGYTNCSIASNNALVLLAHPKQELLGKNLYEVVSSLSPEAREKQKTALFVEKWRSHESGGISYEQTDTFLPEGVPADMREKYAYQFWGEFNGIPVVVETTTYMAEFLEPAAAICRRHQGLMAEMERGAAQAGRSMAGISAAGTLLTFTVIGFLFAWIYRRRFLAPVEAIAANMANFSSGHLESRIPVDGACELKAIGEISFKMADRLSGSIAALSELNASLEERVALRTAELAQTNADLARTNADLDRQREESDRLLLNILPASVAGSLKSRPGETIADEFVQASVLFTDFKGFTAISESVTPARLVSELNEIFGVFDDICISHGMEKIKTIGDSYMAVGGVPERNSTHPADAVRLGLAMRDYMAGRLEDPSKLPLNIRIGIHSGPIIAGVIGKRKFTYDVWGDTVNTASRMESSGEPGKVNVSETTYKLVSNLFDCTSRGSVDAKGKGAMPMYFVDGERG